MVTLLRRAAPGSSLAAMTATLRVAVVGAVLAAGAPVNAAPAPPYEAGLLRLAELLGSIHYLRALCGADDGSRWRDQMNALVEAEVGDEERRRKLVQQFNRGYRSFASVYRDCTPSARRAVESYMVEAAELTSDISVRFSR